jgi:ATP-dependent 26S proteasome regulatory subunit
LLQEVLKIHAGPITKHGEIDYEAVVKLSDGFNGADLRNVCTEAGLFAIRYLMPRLACEDQKIFFFSEIRTMTIQIKF